MSKSISPPPQISPYTPKSQAHTVPSWQRYLGIHHAIRLFSVASDLAGERDPRLAHGIFLGALEAAVGAVPYVFLYFIIRDVIHGAVVWSQIVLLLLGMFAALIVQILLGIRAMVAVMTASYSLFGAARMRVANHIRRLPMGWFTHQRSGALLGILTSDFKMLSEIWSHFIGYLSGGVALPFCVGAWLLYVDWRLGSVMMLTLPIAFLLLYISMRVLNTITKSLLPVMEATNHAIVEYTRGIAVLRTFGRFGEGFRRFEQSVATLKRTSLRAEILPSPLMGIFGFTVEGGFSILAFYSAWMLLQGNIQLDTYLLFIVVSIKFFNPLFDMGVSVLLLRFGQQALERIEGILQEPIIPSPIHSQSIPTTADITIENISFGYSASDTHTDKNTDAALFQNLSLSIPSHHLTAIVGPSGSGKSTLVHLIARLWDVQSGRICIGGIDIRDLTEEDLHQRISMVFQDVVLFSGTIADNIRMGKPNATDQEVIVAAQQAQAHSFIMQFPQGYQTPLGENGACLSGGEKQRISIARALLKNADIILLDEATASIDPSAEAAIQNAINCLIAGKTVIVIAHRLRTIQQAANIIVLRQGCIAEQGTHGELLHKNGLYAHLWRLQTIT